MTSSLKNINRDSQSSDQKSNKQRTVLRHAGLYTFSNLFTQLINVVTAIVIRHFVGPFYMGTWVLIQLIQQYSKYTTLGTTGATLRELPYFRGKGEHEKTQEIESVVLSFGVTVSALTGLAILIVAFIFRLHFSTVIFHGMIAVSIMIVLQRLNNILVTILQSHKEFETVSKLSIYSTLLNFCLVTTLTYFFKFYGLIFSTISIYIFNILYAIRHRSFRFTLLFRSKILTALVSLGLPLVLVGFLGTLFRSIDKMVIANILGLKALGFYSIAIMAVNFVQSIPNSMAVILIPYFEEKFGKRDNIEDLKSYLIKSSRAFSHIMPIMIGLACITGPLMVHWILPAYSEGVHAMLVLLAGTYFFAIQNPYQNFIVTIKKHYYLIAIHGISCLVSLILNYGLITKGFGIEGAAIATLLTFAFNFSWVYWMACSFIRPYKEAAIHFVILWLHAAYLVCVLLILEYLFPYREFRLPQVFYKVLLFLLAYGPYFYRMNKEFELFILFKSKFTSLFRNSKFISLTDGE